MDCGPKCVQVQLAVVSSVLCPQPHTFTRRDCSYDSDLQPHWGRPIISVTSGPCSGEGSLWYQTLIFLPESVQTYTSLATNQTVEAYWIIELQCYHHKPRHAPHILQPRSLSRERPKDKISDGEDYEGREGGSVVVYIEHRTLGILLKGVARRIFSVSVYDDYFSIFIWANNWLINYETELNYFLMSRNIIWSDQMSNILVESN